MRTAGLIANIVSFGLSFVSLDAHANSKAWSAAKLGLPADAKIVVGLDVAALKKTQLFATLYPRLLEKVDAGKAIETLKTACKVDPLGVMQSIVFATSEDQQDGAAYISLTGIDKARLSSCLQVAVQSLDKTAKISVKHDGNITQVSDGTDTRFVGWVGKDIVVVPIRAEDKAALVKWMGGKGSLAKSGVGKALAKVNTSAALWGAGEGTKEVQTGVTLKGGYGAVTFSKGNVDADVHAVAENASQAATMASFTKQQLDEATQAVLLPPALGAVLKTITITSANDEIVFKANVPEADLLSALNLALAMGGP